MGQCDLCGENAGIFKTRHHACDAKAESLKRELRILVLESTLAGKSFGDVYTNAATKIDENRFPITYFGQTMLKAADDVVIQIAQKAPIPEDELTRVVDILNGFGYPQGKRDALLLHRYFGMAFAGMSHTLWGVQHDCPPYFEDDRHTRFNLQRGEQPIFFAGKVTFAEERAVNTGSRGYGGLSVPIGGGAYYHVGASQRRTVSVTITDYRSRPEIVLRDSRSWYVPK